MTKAEHKQAERVRSDVKIEHQEGCAVWVGECDCEPTVWVELAPVAEALREIAGLSPYPAPPENDPYQLGRDQGREDAALIAEALLESLSRTSE